MSILFAGLVAQLLISVVLVFMHFDRTIETVFGPLRRWNRRKKRRKVFKPITKAKQRSKKSVLEFWTLTGQKAVLPGTTRRGPVCWTTGMNKTDCTCATCNRPKLNYDNGDDDDDYDLDIE